MSGSREIRTKINSVKNTQKITRAMELVAASKMRKARDRMEHARPYAHYALNIIHHVVRASMEYMHPYFQTREVKSVGMVIIATDRGLCGGLNINLFKEVLKSIKHYQQQKIEMDLCLIGLKAESFFKRLKGVNVVSVANFHGGDTFASITGAVSVMIKAFDENKIDSLLLFSNKFVNTIKQKPTRNQLLPIVKPEKVSQVDEGSVSGHWDYLYEPDAKYVLDVLLVRYIESQVYRGVVENLACEQAARMLAMKNATDNAGEIIDSLKLQYNKARQAMITQELAEIVSGAAAV
ncbi:F0F1 ATP synthase subunit gamma [Fastidiosibacter lacustris]|uniref:F0F1 ATP synthase subunit gamma n=1 Tax=Fastidiosibacter lacustris TaxID=2056695 RepID=UPI000E34FF00|nr:F0F1 ATP synthase subunit gamma [Fastidiosibacter lacustris]